MTLRYEEDGDEVSIEGEHCPSCYSTETFFDRVFRSWKCERCSMVWNEDDDPDYEDAEEIEESDRP
jgi:ribosomal protein L37AE/L43A